MTDVTDEVAGTPAPDANVSPQASSEADATQQPEGNEADPSPAAADASEKPDKSIEDMQKRVNKVTANWRQTEREKEYWREQAMRQAPAQQPEPVKAAEPAKFPALADYDYDEAKHTQAVLEFTRAEARREAEAVLKAERDRQNAERRQQTWKQKADEFAKSTPDFNELVSDPTLPITAEMAQAVQDSEIGPELAYHLASNRDVAEQVSRMSGTALALALGRIEGRLIAQKELAARPAAAPQVTKAPPPPPKIDAVNPSASVRTTDASGDTLSIEAWVELERKRLAKKRAKG
jgi:hypothetical protein